jgi:3-phosphoshikimate 1-carboxyvinyltransferase
VLPGGYHGREITVEGDHSTASYFLAAPAVAGGRVRVRGTRPESRQADACFGDLLEKFGCGVERGADWIEVRRIGPIPGFDVSMEHAPDLVPTLVALALFAEGPSVVRDVGHLRLKESDRLERLAHNIRVLGRRARARADSLEIGPPDKRLRPGTIVTGGDHRIAMAFAVVGLGAPGIVLDDADCVTKSDPGFWARFDRLVRGGPA